MHKAKFLVITEPFALYHDFQMRAQKYTVAVNSIGKLKFIQRTSSLSYNILQTRAAYIDSFLSQKALLKSGVNLICEICSYRDHYFNSVGQDIFFKWTDMHKSIMSPPTQRKIIWCDQRMQFQVPNQVPFHKIRCN